MLHTRSFIASNEQRNAQLQAVEHIKADEITHIPYDCNSFTVRLLWNVLLTVIRLYFFSIRPSVCMQNKYIWPRKMMTENLKLHWLQRQRRKKVNRCAIFRAQFLINAIVHATQGQWTQRNWPLPHSLLPSENYLNRLLALFFTFYSHLFSVRVCVCVFIRLWAEILMQPQWKCQRKNCSMSECFQNQPLLISCSCFFFFSFYLYKRSMCPRIRMENTDQGQCNQKNKYTKLRQQQDKKVDDFVSSAK